MNEISTLLKNWFEQEKQRKQIGAELKKLEKPAQPTYFESVEDMNDWIEQAQAYDTKEQELRSAHGEAIKAIEKAEATLKKAIPIENCWLKVEVDGKAYGVGTYWDAWGGTHKEVRVEEWCEQLKDNPPRNRLEYN